MLLYPEEEQEKALAKSLKKIKEQTYFINTTIDKPDNEFFNNTVL